MIRIWAAKNGNVVGDSLTLCTLQFWLSCMNFDLVAIRGSQSHVEMVLGNFHVKGHDRSVANNGLIQD